MQQLKLHKNIIADFYGTQTIVIIGDSLFTALAPMLPGNIRAFSLSAEGDVHAGPKSDGGDPGGTLVGTPDTIAAILVGPREKAAADALLAHAKQHGAHILPEVKLCKSTVLARFKKAALLKFLSKALVLRAERLRRFAAANLSEVSALRQQYEQLALNYEKARLMLRQAGKEERRIIVDLPPGNGRLEPPAGEDAYAFSQVLPSDLAVFSGVWLHVSEAPKAQKGIFNILIRRIADRGTIAAISKPYADMSTGWQRFYFDPYIQWGTGDIEICLEWSGEGGPVLSMADTVAIDFGDEQSRSLALRIETGLAEPEETLPVLLQSSGIRISGAEFAENAALAGSRAQIQALEDEIGGEIYEVNRSEGWFKLHGHAEQPVGLRSPMRLPASAAGCSMRVSLPARSAGACVFLMAVVPEGYSAEELPELLGILFDADLMQGQESTSGAEWVKKIVTGGEYATLDLRRSALNAKPCDVLVAVKPVANSHESMSCFWHSFDWYEASEKKCDKSFRPLYIEAVTPPSLIQAFKVNELGYDLSFYKGRGELDQISKKFGFTPFWLDDDIAGLQTHPYGDNPSVALVTGKKVTSAKRIMCEIELAHPAASECIFVLGIIPFNSPDKVALIDGVMERAKTGLREGLDQNHMIEWVAFVPRPLLLSQLCLDVQGLAEMPCDIFMGTVPVDDEASFAWCRWYSLMIETVEDQTGSTLLDPSIVSSSELSLRQE